MTTFVIRLFVTFMELIAAWWTFEDDFVELRSLVNSLWKKLYRRYVPDEPSSGVTVATGILCVVVSVAMSWFSFHMLKWCGLLVKDFWANAVIFEAMYAVEHRTILEIVIYRELKSNYKDSGLLRGKYEKR